jgi:hypothetical protein
VDIPIATPAYVEQCGGMYPTELYSLSWTIDDAIKTLDPLAQGWAEAMVQSCIDKDGKAYDIVFGIWFRIVKPTPDFKDYETLGSWIIDVMNLLDTISREEYFINAAPSTVTFTFFADNSESLEVIVPIQEYWAKANGKSGTEVFLMFYTEPPGSPTPTQSP